MSSTNLTDFRNQYLARAKARLTAVDLANADDNTLILAGAVLRSYDSVNRFDAIIPEAIAPIEGMTSAELDAYLQDASNRQSFELVLSSQEAMKAMAASVPAMAAVAGSTRGMNAVAASSVARTALLASSVAMTAIIASPLATTKLAVGIVGLDPLVFPNLDAVAASTTAMTALSASASGMNLLGASSAARTALLNNGSAMNVLRASSIAMAKLASGAAGLDPVVWSDMVAVAASSSATSAVAGAMQALNFIVPSAVAMTAVAASSAAMAAMIANATAFNVIVASSTAMIAIAASGMAMNAVAASNSAMNTIAASSAALAVLAVSANAMTALNASNVSMDALYASPLISKVSYESTATWATITALRNGIGLFVRLTTKAGNAGWGEGNASNEYAIYDGVTVVYSERAANPYNHTALTASPRLPMRRFASSLAYRGYAAVEFAFIPLTA